MDDFLRTNLIPAITGRSPPNDLEYDLFALPAQLGGLGIHIPSKNAYREQQSSEKVTLSLSNHILDQYREYGYDIINDQLQNKAYVSKDNKKRNQEEADKIYGRLSDRLQKAVDLAKEKGASTWLTCSSPPQQTMCQG